MLSRPTGSDFWLEAFLALGGHVRRRQRRHGIKKNFYTDFWCRIRNQSGQIDYMASKYDAFDNFYQVTNFLIP